MEIAASAPASTHSNWVSGPGWGVGPEGGAAALPEEDRCGREGGEDVSQASVPGCMAPAPLRLDGPRVESRSQGPLWSLLPQLGCPRRPYWVSRHTGPNLSCGARDAQGRTSSGSQSHSKPEYRAVVCQVRSVCVLTL